MNSLLQGVKDFLAPLNPAQKVMFFGFLLIITLFIGGVFWWTLKPEYTLLFGSLHHDSAREIVEELDERNVNYRLEDDGRTIYVPHDKVHELRLQLASDGFAHSDLQGYELFDTNALGMTDFMQRMNKKRALEGEIARTINSLNQVEFSRIHLVLPERSPFRESQVEASASIILNLKRGNRLDPKQVEGITSLVAGSVEGLEASGVTVLDQAGNRLTSNVGQSTDFATGSLQMQMKQKTENYLTEQGQSMLDRVLGPGNSIVRVSAEHDFDRLVRESDLIDPDSRMIISEERRTESSSNESFQPVPIDEFTPIDQRGDNIVTSQNEQESSIQTRNYEANTTREIFEKAQGEIKRLSASVLLNYKQTLQTNEEGEQVLVNEPYSQEEIEEFRETIRLALGISPDRGDELTITQIEFYDPTSTDQFGLYTDRPMPWNEIIRWTLIALTFFTIVFLVLRIRRRMEMPDQVMVGLPDGSRESVPLMEGDANHKSLEEMEEDEKENFVDRKLSENDRKQLKEKQFAMEEIQDFFELKPAEAAQTIRAFMTLDEDGK